MLPLFRKIRKQHADDNQFLKYARYAVGEIVLVVLGILIALQINNWNEERKERMVEVRYLENLKNDLENDSLALLTIRAHRMNTVEASKRLLNIANSGHIDDIYEIDSLYWAIGIWWEFIPNDNTFQELISSGNLNLIKDEKIKKALLKLSKDSEQIAVDRDHMRREYDQYLYDQMVSTISFLNTKSTEHMGDRWESWFYSNRETMQLNRESVTQEYEVLLQNSVFINGVALAGGNSQYLISVYDRVLIDISELIRQIDKALSN